MDSNSEKSKRSLKLLVVLVIGVIGITFSTMYVGDLEAEQKQFELQRKTWFNEQIQKPDFREKWEKYSWVEVKGSAKDVRCIDNNHRLELLSVYYYKCFPNDYVSMEIIENCNLFTNECTEICISNDRPDVFYDITICEERL